ncbi:MAG: hypothetical protein IPK57_02760 [Chitinophagaceae bacterium]|nr:hypothetical protein [Chitinophagaceae bacterium]
MGRHNKGLLCQKLKPLPITTHLMAPSRNDVQSVGYNSFSGIKINCTWGEILTLALVIADASSMKIEKEISFEELWQNQSNGNGTRYALYKCTIPTLWIGTNAGIIWFDTKHIILVK